MAVTCMEVDTDRETQLERRLKRRCLRDPIVTHTSLQNGAPERTPRRTDRVDFVEDKDYVNFLKNHHNNNGFVPLEAYRCGSSSCSDDLVDPQYKIFFESLRVTKKSYELEVQVNVGTSILLKYEIEDQPNEGLTLEDLKSRTLKNNAEMVRSSRNAVGREKDKVADPRRNKSDKERRIPRNVSGREKESLQTTKAAAASKRNCNSNKRNIEARPANLGSNHAIRQSPRVLCPEVQQALEHEEETYDESYLAFLNCAKEDFEFTTDHGKQTTKAAATGKRNFNLDTRNIEAQPANLGSNQASRWSPRVSRPEDRQSPEHEEETWDESYLTFLHCAREDGSILEFLPNNGKQIRYEEDEEEESSCEVEMLAGEDIYKCEEFVTMKLSKDPISIDSKHIADDPGSSSDTLFRKKLMGVLKIPYDAKEHEDLSQRVRHKRQKTVEKSLRQGRDFTSSLGQSCKSYLELYKDLAKELKSVRGDCHRSLNLLRGFFFWLENVPKEGAFKPWLDTTCLEVLPAQAIRSI